MAKHFFIPRGIKAFHEFYNKPRDYFTQVAVTERLNLQVGAIGGNILQQAMVLIIQYETLNNNNQAGLVSDVRSIILG